MAPTSKDRADEDRFGQAQGERHPFRKPEEAGEQDAGDQDQDDRPGRADRPDRQEQQDERQHQRRLHAGLHEDLQHEAQQDAGQHGRRDRHRQFLDQPAERLYGGGQQYQAGRGQERADGFRHRDPRRADDQRGARRRPGGNRRHPVAEAQDGGRNGGGETEHGEPGRGLRLGRAERLGGRDDQRNRAAEADQDGDQRRRDDRQPHGENLIGRVSWRRRRTAAAAAAQWGRPETFNEHPMFATPASNRMARPWMVWLGSVGLAKFTFSNPSATTGPDTMEQNATPSAARWPVRERRLEIQQELSVRLEDATRNAAVGTGRSAAGPGRVAGQAQTIRFPGAAGPAGRIPERHRPAAARDRPPDASGLFRPVQSECDVSVDSGGSDRRAFQSLSRRLVARAGRGGDRAACRRGGRRPRRVAPR